MKECEGKPTIAQENSIQETRPIAMPCKTMLIKGKRVVLGSNDIKTHGSESRGQEEAACTRVFWPTRPLQ